MTTTEQSARGILSLSVDYAKDTPRERTFQLLIAGSLLAILDQQYLPYFVKYQKDGVPTEEAMRYKTEVPVTIYDDRYPDFQAWVEARSAFVKIQIEPSPFTDRHLISIYDNGPYEEIKDAEGEVTHQNGDNLGFAVDLGMPDMAEWGIIYAPLWGESPNEYTARQMQEANALKDFLGDTGFVIQPDGHGSMESKTGADLPHYTDEQIAAARSA